MKCVPKWFVLAIAGLSVALASGGARAGSYPQVGGGPGHLGVALAAGPTDLSAPRWTAVDAAGTQLQLSWVSQAGVAVGLGKVVGLATSLDSQNQPVTLVVAVDERDGRLAWTAQVPAPAWESWSSPTIDELAGVALVAAGNRLTAFRMEDGYQMWYLEAQSGKSFVNASPTAADGVAFIVEFQGGANLYAVDTFTGNLLWQRPAGYTAGANTVAVTDTKVVLATGYPFWPPYGEIRTFDRYTGTPDPILRFDGIDGFFGGVAAEGDFAYVVSYAFQVWSEQTRLYKINLQTRQVVWAVDAPRTDTIPVVTDTMVLVSGGDGYDRMGNDTDAPGLWAFDKGTGAKMWHTPLAGGWAAQPVCDGRIVYVPTQRTPNFSPSRTTLYALDTRLTPTAPGFVVASTNLIGNSVAVANGNVYGTGNVQSGTGQVLGAALAAFGPPLRNPGDIDGDGFVNVFDIFVIAESWNAQMGDPFYNPACDLDGDGYINVFDIFVIAEYWNT